MEPIEHCLIAIQGDWGGEGEFRNVRRLNGWADKTGVKPEQVAGDDAAADASGLWSVEEEQLIEGGAGWMCVCEADNRAGIGGANNSVTLIRSGKSDALNPTRHRANDRQDHI